MGAEPATAEVLAVGELAPGRLALQLRAPHLVAQLRPGHALHLLRAEAGGFRLRRVAPVTAVDPLGGAVEVGLQPRADGGRDSLAEIRSGERVVVAGPIGQPIARLARTTNLLIVCDADGFAWIRLLAHAAVAEGRSVVVIHEGPSAADLVSASLLPERVEIAMVTGDGSLGLKGRAVDAMDAYAEWAEQVVAAGSPILLAAVLAAARRRRPSNERAAARATAKDLSWLSLVVPHEIGCGSGVCGGCSIATRSGSLRLCREGPALSGSEIASPVGGA
jgi:dihydroorotate dehydrogenase electron transfer subunit